LASLSQKERELINDLWRRRHELTKAEWLEAAPVLLGYVVALLSSAEVGCAHSNVVETVDESGQLVEPASDTCVDCGHVFH
jgi:hypothetical protein